MRAKYWLICESCLFDPDGNASEATKDFIRVLMKHHSPFLVLSEDTAKSRKTKIQELNDLGFPVSEQHFYTSMMAAIDEIAMVSPEKIRAGYLGGRGMKDTLTEANFLFAQGKADWIFVGNDHNSGSIEYNYVFEMLLRGAKLICTDNREVDYSGGKPMIGGGSITKMLETASGQEAHLTGFPSNVFLERAVNYLQGDPYETVLIGTNLKREILSAKNSGLGTIYCTGYEESGDLFESDIHPDYVIENLEGIARSLQER